MRRVLAVLGAVAMVAGAVLIRRGLDDDGANHDNADDRIVIVCATDLGTYCGAYGDKVEVRLETAAVTAEAVRTGSLADDVDGWVTSSAWVELLGRESERLGDPEQLATSPITVATRTDRVAALEAVCARKAIWACLATNAGAGWDSLGQDIPGRLEVGVPNADSATGLPVLASIAAGALDGVDFASNDFDADFKARMADLIAPSGTTEKDPVGTMVTHLGGYSAAGAPSARVTEIGRDDLVTIDTLPEVRATIVVVPISGGDRLPSADPVREALVADSWTAASGSDLTPTLKDGVMSALHAVWLEALR